MRESNILAAVKARMHAMDELYRQLYTVSYKNLEEKKFTRLERRQEKLFRFTAKYD